MEMKRKGFSTKKSYKELHEEHLRGNVNFLEQRLEGLIGDLQKKYGFNVSQCKVAFSEECVVAPWELDLNEHKMFACYKELVRVLDKCKMDMSPRESILKRMGRKVFRFFAVKKLG